MNSASFSTQAVPNLRQASSDQATKLPQVDDMAMIRAAAELTRDLTAPSPGVYWADFLSSSAVGYGALYLAVTAQAAGLVLVFAAISVLALFRAGSFIHELAHIKRAAVPGFWPAWNAIIGIPMLVPSFLYEGVHNLHHARTRYGTAEDPEYLPLALMKPHTVPLFVLIAILGPIGLFMRFAVLAPLSAIFPSLRRIVVARYSGLVINPAFRRRAPEGEARRQWMLLETACGIWAITLLGMILAGILPLRMFLIALGIVSATILLNQVRTLVAHLWENDGNVMSVTSQFLDSVNVPPPALFAAFWAPVGLRYHAIHHLLPGLPYHSLGEAHRRLSKALGQNSTYQRASYPGLPGLVIRLVKSSLRASD
jgi:fatty acid desaturase